MESSCFTRMRFHKKSIDKLKLSQIKDVYRVVTYLNSYRSDGVME
jgi:hypothetical protein